MRNLMLIVLGVLITTAAHAQLKVSKYPKVFKGGEGVSVTVLALVPEDENRALVQVKGVDGELDGKVFLYTIEEQGRGSRAFVSKVDGDDATLMRAEEGYWNKLYEVYLPHSERATSVWYDEKASQKVSADALVKQYEKTDRLLQEKRARFDRAGAQKRSEESLAEQDREAQKACGSKLATHVDWPSVDDATLLKYSLASFCGLVAENLASLCGSEKDKPVAARISAVTCKRGPKPKLQRSEDKLTFVVDPADSDIRAFVQGALRNEL